MLAQSPAMPQNDARATGISLSDYAMRSKQLLSLVNHLRGIGFVSDFMPLLVANRSPCY